jgi:hypothetical protein
MKKISHADQRNAPEDIVLDESEVAAPPAATAEQIAEVVRIARLQYRLDRRVKAVDKVLKRAKQNLQANKTVLLPKAMTDAGMDECPLGENGLKVEMYTDISASIPSLKGKAENKVERNKAGIDFMDKRAPAMIDTVLTIRFPKGTEKDLAKFMRDNAKRKKPLEMEIERNVNTASLGAWVRAELDAGREVDEEALNVFKLKVAEIVTPKKKKEKILE